MVFQVEALKLEEEMDNFPGYPHGLGVLCDGIPVPDPFRAELVN